MIVEQATIDFDGSTYVHARDFHRLKKHIEKIHKLMADGEWRTLHSIVMSCGGSEAGVSARLRDLRKAKFGAHVVRRRRITGGLFEYQLDAPPNCSCPVAKGIKETLCESQPS